jgi:cysteine desulfurase
MTVNKPIYLDCNATTPIEPRVADVIMEFMLEDFGNSGSRTHEFGVRANKAVRRSRERMAEVVGAMPDEVIFTSGATESNNLAILGLRNYGDQLGKKHIVSSMIEHKAVLEPLEHLSSHGFTVDLIRPSESGIVNPHDVARRLRDDTLLVSVMHVNNETGAVQPIGEISNVLAKHEAYFHVDAAQGFGKRIDDLQNKRIDLMSISGHKIYGPKGIGALIIRRRGYDQVPLSPLTFGGGQERGIRPGTLPVELIVGLGVAAEMALENYAIRRDRWSAIREAAIDALKRLDPVFNCDLENSIETTLNFSLPGIDSEALIVALKGEIAISNGSACTSSSYKPSHVLEAMGLEKQRIQQAVRLSWCHLTEDHAIVARIKSFI